MRSTLDQIARFAVIGVASTIAYVEVAVLVAANAIATLCRFVLLRALIARSGRPARQSPLNVERTAS
jgi:hypothetical protein